MKYFDVKGDDKSIPDAGVGAPVTDSYGADLGVDAKNKVGSVNGNSDPVERTKGVENKS